MGGVSPEAHARENLNTFPRPSSGPARAAWPSGIRSCPPARCLAGGAGPAERRGVLGRSQLGVGNSAFSSALSRTLSIWVRLFGEALVGRFGGVDSVHTLGPGLGRTGAGLGRIPYVSVGVQCLQGLEPGSSPTSGTCFPCSGACGPLSVHKLFTDGPLRGPFLLVAVAVAGWLLSYVVDGSGLVTSSWVPAASTT